MDISFLDYVLEGKKKKNRLTHGGICVNDGSQNQKIILYVPWFLIFLILPNETEHIMESHNVPFFSLITEWHPLYIITSSKCTFVHVEKYKSMWNWRSQSYSCHYPWSFWDTLISTRHIVWRLFNQCQRPTHLEYVCERERESLWLRSNLFAWKEGIYWATRKGNTLWMFLSRNF